MIGGECEFMSGSPEKRVRNPFKVALLEPDAPAEPHKRRRYYR